MLSTKRYTGDFKYLGSRSSSNDWKKGYAILQESQGILYLKTYLDVNPQRVYKQSEISPGSVKECSFKSSRVIISFKTDAILHFRQAVSDPSRLEDDVNKILQGLLVNGKPLVKNRAEVGCSMPPPTNRLYQSPMRHHSYDVEAVPLSDHYVPPGIPTPDSSPGTSPLRFTSVKENRKSCPDKVQLHDEESKENQYRGPISAESDRQGKRGDRVPLQVTSSGFYGSSVSSSFHSSYKKIARPNLINSSANPAPFSVNRPQLGANVSYSWNKSSLSSYNTKENTPELQGFANIGNTCYMNAILQSLFSLDTFASDLVTLSRAHSRGFFNGSLAIALSKLLYGRRKPQVVEMQKMELLRNVKRAISSTAKRFSGSQQHDAHEFLGQVLDQLKEEVLKASKVSDANPANISSGTLTTTPVKDKLPTPNARHDGAETPESATKRHPSPTAVNPTLANFEFEVVHSIECLSCGEFLHKAEQFNDLSVDIPSNSIPGIQISLQDALGVFFQKETIEYTCEKCGHKKAEVSHKFSKVPRVLILHLKRYTYDAGMSQNSKMRQRIHIPRFISLSDHCDQTTQPHSPFSCMTLNSPAKQLLDSSYKRRKLQHLVQHGNSKEQPNTKVRRLFADEPNCRVGSSFGDDSKIEPEPQSKSTIDLLEEEEKQLKQALALSLKETTPLSFDHSYSANGSGTEEDANNNHGDVLSDWNPIQTEMDITADIAESDLERMTLDQQIAIAINRSLASPLPHLTAPSPTQNFASAFSPSAQMQKQHLISEDKFSLLLPKKPKDYSNACVKSSGDAQKSSLLLPRRRESSDSSNEGFNHKTSDFDKGTSNSTRSPPHSKCFVENKAKDSAEDMVGSCFVAEKAKDLGRFASLAKSLNGSSMDLMGDDEIWEVPDADARTAKLVALPKEGSRQNFFVSLDDRSVRARARLCAGMSESSSRFNGSSDSRLNLMSHEVLEEDSQNGAGKVQPSAKWPSVSSFRSSLVSHAGTSPMPSQNFNSNIPAGHQNVCPYPRLKELKTEMTDCLSSLNSEKHILKEQAVARKSSVVSAVEDFCWTDGANGEASCVSSDAEDLTCISESREGRDQHVRVGCEPVKISRAEESAEPGILPSAQMTGEMEEKENILPHHTNLPSQTLQVDPDLEAKIAEYRGKFAEMERGVLPYSYRLVSVVNHLGEMSDSGHYVSDAYDMKKQSWFSYDDSKVSHTTESEVLTSRSRSGYIFFYLSKDIYDEFLSLAATGNELMQRR